MKNYKSKNWEEMTLDDFISEYKFVIKKAPTDQQKELFRIVHEEALSAYHRGFEDGYKVGTTVGMEAARNEY